MSRHVMSQRTLLLLLMCMLLVVCAANSDCVSDETGTQVKCLVHNLHDLFSNFSSIHPDQISKLEVDCTTDTTFSANQPFLFGTEIDAVMNNTFGLMKNLRELVIVDCKLITIPPMAFNGLSQLTNLTLRTRNYRQSDVVLHLSAETFSQLQLLEKLDLGESNINNLPQTLLCPLRRLETLNLTSNNFSDISSVGLSTGNRDNVLCLVDVQRVRLSYNRIKVLTNKGFAAVNQLKELRLDHNFISRAEEAAFNGLDKLKVLDLSNNQVVALPPYVLRGCEELTELYLQNNSISVLPPGLFTGLQQLSVLDLSHNEITSHWLGSDTFADLIRIATLDASYNRLTHIDATIFRSQYSLQILHLDNNDIEAISDYAFSSLYKLHTLFLNNNRITKISASVFYGLNVLGTLLLGQNDIYDIHPDAFRNNSAVMEISFANNKLSDVPIAVQSLSMLRSLDLSHNKITDIHNASYLGLDNLYSLILFGNQIGNLSRGAFESLPSIRILNLANNEIESIETNTFDDVAYLHALRLDSNLLSEVNGLFSNLHDLMMLNVSVNRIEWFDYALIPVGLQWLDMHDNQIEILGNYFELEGSLKLRTLDASFNHITEIDSSSLPDGIEIVFLNNNLIKKIEALTFLGKPNLTRVDLTRNLLENLEVNAFRLTEVRNRKPLPEFSISENPYLCDCNMEWIQRVDSLDDSRQYPRMVDVENISCQLSFNRQRKAIPIIDAQSSEFLCNYKNHCFALCHCCEFDACDCEMVCPENCTCFYDQSWNTNIVDCSSQNHLSVPRRIPMDVTELYLDGNDIPSLSSHTFIGRKNMQVLFMNNSNVHVINNRTFNGLKSLQSLHLERNLIVLLHGYEFERLVNLRHLYLSYNRISAIGNTTFLHLRSLEILHLDHNYITQFQVWNLNQNLKLVDIQLSNNPWICECQFVGDFTFWLLSRSDLIHDVHNVNCIYNETFTLPLVEFNMTTCTNYSSASPSYIQAYHTPDMWIFFVVGAVVVVLILIIVCVCLWRYRAKLWCFPRCGVRVFNADGRSSSEEDKAFDAFISYSKKDEAFVHQVLVSELEFGSTSYRLCLHYRDLPPGGYMSDSIIDAIESSHKIILVLSENFIRTEWHRYEFKSAHHEILRANKLDLIVIIIGPLDQRDIDPDLRMWFKMCTVIYWGEKKFFERLRYALPDTRRRQPNHRHVSDHSISIHI